MSVNKEMKALIDKVEKFFGEFAKDWDHIRQKHLDKISSALEPHEDDAEPQQPEPTPLVVIQPLPKPPEPPAAPAPVAAPTPHVVPGRPGETVEQLYRDTFAGSPFHWEVGYAIFKQETGGTSRLWVQDHNPGGIKAYDGASSGSVGASGFMKYETPEAGVTDHLNFLMRPHYTAARNLDYADQVHAIWEAGYSEQNQEWLRNVQKFVGQLTGTAEIPKPRQVSGQAIAGAALLFVGRPFQYADGTANGSLGCANVVSAILIQAGAFDRLELSVAGLVAGLKALGWKPALGGLKSGDVIDWAGTEETGNHQHVGVVSVEGGEVWTVQNSSSHHDVEHIRLADYPRQIRQVLRAPGAWI